jgi:hypothetical protein
MIGLLTVTPARSQTRVLTSMGQLHHTLTVISFDYSFTALLHLNLLQGRKGGELCFSFVKTFLPTLGPVSIYCHKN